MANMRISRLSVSNFKSFKDAVVTLGPLNVIVGANASGKSNLIQVLKFLRDATWDGLDNAISMQGGCEYLRNIGIGKNRPTVVEVEMEGASDWPIILEIPKAGKRTRLLGLRITSAKYRIDIHYKKRGLGLRVCDDCLDVTCDVYDLKGRRSSKDGDGPKLGSGKLSIHSNTERVRSRIEPVFPDVPEITADRLFPREILKWLELRGGEGKLPSAGYLEFVGLYRILGGVALFDFDPKPAKRGAPITGRTRLDSDASNLAIVLRSIKADKQKVAKFLTLMNDLAPFVDAIGADEFKDKSVLLKVTEKYFGGRAIYAPFVSDGTINMAALVIALYFDNRPIVVIEEPERNVHPHIIDKIVEMMADASNEKQVITTTHNPIMVGSVDPTAVLLVRRDSEGYSQIDKPADNAEVRELLKSEIGLGRLLEQNLLGALR